MAYVRTVFPLIHPSTRIQVSISIPLLYLRVSTSTVHTNSTCFTQFLDIADMVGLLVRWPDDPEHEKVLVFKLISTEPDAAAAFANQVCKQLANLHYTTDHVSL